MPPRPYWPMIGVSYNYIPVRDQRELQMWSTKKEQGDTILLEYSMGLDQEAYIHPRSGEIRKMPPATLL